MSEFFLVDVKSITSTVSRSEFSVDELEKLAQSILTVDGLLVPLILKQTGVESYEVLAGDREYYAAVRAKEINPHAAEMVNAFVIPDDRAAAAVEQIAALPPQPSAASAPASVSAPQAASSNTEQRLTNLESRLDTALQEIKQSHRQDMQRLEQQVTTLQQQIPQKVDALDVFNHASPVELLQKLAIAGIKGKTAEKLIKGIEKARSKTPFTSFTDVVERTDGLAAKRMLTILDAWNGLF